MKYGPIKLINQEVDVCESVQKVNETCPLEKGELKFTQTVMIPGAVPKVCLSCCCFVSGLMGHGYANSRGVVGEVLGQGECLYGG